MEGQESSQTSEPQVSTMEISVEQKSEAKNDLESKSADDILNELFTELGSKNFTESVADFLKTPSKKKKKHKEKKESKKLKSKGTKSKKKKKEESSPKKRKKSDGDEQVGSDGEGIIERKSRTEKKKSSKTKEYTNNEREKDVEEGEIIEKHSGSHHRTKSSHKETTSSKHSKSAAWISPTHEKEFVDEVRSRDRREDNYIEGRRSSAGGKEYHKSRSRSPRGDRDVSHGSRSRSRHEYPDLDKRRHFDRSPPSYRGDAESRHHASRNSRRRSPLYNRRQRDDSRSDFRSRRFIPEHDRRRIAPPYRRSRSRSRSHPRYGSEVIDKEKLLEIARRNATVLMKKGVLPTDIFSKDQIVAIKAGGKSVEDLTAYCRKIAAKDAKRGDGDLSDDDGLRSDDGEAEHFIHHPFVVKERPMPQITLNIRNAIPLPVRTPQALAIENAVRKSQFPVSSGCQHRFKELEWKEVDEDQEKNKCKLVATIAPTPAPAPVETPEPETEAKPVPPVPPVDPVPPIPPKDTGISLEPPELPHVDIGSVISARLKAMRALKENPECEEAKKELDSALVEMEQWAQAKALEPKFLSVSDLTSGPQAWAKRDQLKNAKQVASGMGMHLLQKMGWRPGEGLGKNKEGSTEPLALDVKTDKKGLMSQADLKVKGPQANVSMLYDLSGKHPVSALMELCTKRRWGPPVFDLCFEHGPPHQKSFVFKVTVNGVEYQPCIATNNKKLAKANAAAFCLQSLGLLKPAATAAPAETLQTVPGPGATSGSSAEATGMRMLPSHLLQTVPSHP